MEISTYHKSFIQERLKVGEISSIDRIQSLWSGYGGIYRCHLVDSELPSVIVKLIQHSSKKNHPRGWNTNISHLRKVRSYEVECYFYQNFAEMDRMGARIPTCLGWGTVGSDMILILEDLDVAGYGGRKHHIQWEEVSNCIQWLADFHGYYMGVSARGLWPVGTYWHLDTRPDEFEAMEEKWLKKVAHQIDNRLNACPYKTLVHGDAKLANFCFSEHDQGVAAVDFQYVGGGCGMKDLAYFLGSCLSDSELFEKESLALDIYFSSLGNALKQRNDQNAFSINEIERSWRQLYPLAVADFHRFLCGWSPGHWKLNSYSEQISKKVADQLIS